MKKNIRITVYGKVQGVSFRKNTKRIAEHLGVKGFVQNQPNETVYIEAEADPSLIDQLLTWCKTGPKRAIVKKIDQQEGDLQHYEEFNIRHT